MRNLVKTFRRAGGGTVRPVDHVDLTVADDELVVLLGPSGCGKTTLLRCVAGLETPDSGEILIDGQLVFSSEKNVFVPPERRDLSMIFQSFALWPHMTVAQNIAYPLQARRVPRGEIAGRVAQVLELVGVGGLGDQYPSHISGGQQQRVALARALVANSNIVLFDEPLSSVDAKVREQLRYELTRMQRQIGFSGLYVTHDQTEAMEIGHRIAVLQSGRIAALGEPRTVYEHPANEYVANFLGMANIWDGTVAKRQEGLLAVDTALGQLSIDAVHAGRGAAALAAGDAVRVVTRPEKLHIAAAPDPRSPNCLPARIEARIFSGPHVEYMLQTEGGMVRAWMHEDSDIEALPPGSQVWLSVDPRRIRILQPSAERPEAEA